MGVIETDMNAGMRFHLEEIQWRGAASKHLDGAPVPFEQSNMEVRFTLNKFIDEGPEFVGPLIFVIFWIKMNPEIEVPTDQKYRLLRPYHYRLEGSEIVCGIDDKRKSLGYRLPPTSLSRI